MFMFFSEWNQDEHRLKVFAQLYSVSTKEEWKMYSCFLQFISMSTETGHHPVWRCSEVNRNVLDLWALMQFTDQDKRRNMNY